MSESNEKMLIGWGAKDVTPKGRVSLQGQFHVRLSDAVNDPLSTTALAVESENSKEQAIIVSLDAIGVANYVTNGCREVLKKAIPDFDPGKMLISATHTHTAPAQPREKAAFADVKLPEDVLTKEEYSDFLIKQISAAAIDAWNSRKPGALSWGRGHAVVGFNRRVSYLDGSTTMYGKTDIPNFSHIEGYEDHGVDLLFTYDNQHQLTGMIVNVPCPSQCTEGAYFVSADFWHETRQVIRKNHGEQLFILPQCAAAGDQSPRTMVNRRADARMLRLKGYGDEYNQARRQDIAAKIAAAVNDVLPLAAREIHDQVEFCHTVEDIDLPCRIASDDDLSTAKREVAEWKRKLEELGDADPSSIAYSSVFRRISFNQRVIDFYEAQQRGEDRTRKVESHVLLIDDIAMCSNCFEYFLDFGLRIKERSNALQTFIVQLAGEGRYLPTERAMKGGGYGAYIASTPIGPEGGQLIVDRQVETINKKMERK